MNSQQQMFYNYAMNMVQDGKQDELKAVLAENFKAQDDGTLNGQFMAKQGPKLIALLKPEFQQAMTNQMNQYLGKS